jgi:hypothetical protein
MRLSTLLGAVFTASTILSVATPSKGETSNPTVNYVSIPENSPGMNHLPSVAETDRSTAILALRTALTENSSLAPSRKERGKKKEEGEALSSLLDSSAPGDEWLAQASDPQTTPESDRSTTPAGETPAPATPAAETPAGETPAGETPAGETPQAEPFSPAIPPTSAPQPLFMPLFSVY